MRAAIAAMIIAAGIWHAASAHAQDPPGSSYGPTSIATPVGSPAGRLPAAPRLVRAASSPTPWPRGGGYHITQDAWRPRGPLEIRDEWILAQPKMTMPAVSPDPLPRGAWELHVRVDRGSDFGWTQTTAGDTPRDRRFIVDGEHQTTEANVRYGLFDKLSLGLRVPIHWRGAGFLDGIIDWYHETFEFVGLMDNIRSEFSNDRYRVHGRDDARHPISWDDKRGVGLGNIELEAHWSLLKPRTRTDWRLAWIGRLALPTGSDPYDSGFDAGMQIVVAKSLGQRWDIYGGVGLTWFSDTELDGVQYKPFRVSGFLALEYALSKNWSALVETNAASRLVTNLSRYPGEHWYLNTYVRVDIAPGLEWELGFTENLESQQGTIDFGAFTGLTARF